MSFQTYAVGYPVTFVIMLISSVLTGTLAAKLKMHARLSAQLAFRTQILFDTDRLLQKARSQKEILEITCTQLARLFDRSIVAYAAVNGRLAEGHLFSEKEKAEDQSYLTLDEQQIARWVYTNKKRAGATTHYYKIRNACIWRFVLESKYMESLVFLLRKMYWIRLNTVFCCLCLTDALLPWIMPETQKRKKKMQ